jgi:hypothetical protein
MTSRNKKFLILENDWTISDQLKRYADVTMKNRLIVTGANNRHRDEILEALESHDVLVFEPNLIEYNQYNQILMLMHEQLAAGRLSITEVIIFHFDKDLAADLSSLWERRRTALDAVLKKVTIYQYLPQDQKLKKLKI